MEQNSLSVEQLFDSFKSGGEKAAEKAFARLFELHYQRLCLFASAYLPGDLLTEDIVNESWAKAWGKRKTYKSHDHFLHSLYHPSAGAEKGEKSPAGTRRAG
jgi:DNA-directed RNA polymerase specialized sigma24 family protein